ncbi:Forkhead box protein J1 [Vanrija pseudolonga]|uniref:Forkhead box protein J1 n=1 Tax=Vanrija pseudolonga TaxID=143232 RepID=A0AAF1BES1_9TREE|nr:Forkhead box protein J1 [Vanrija pseudolonga]
MPSYDFNIHEPSYPDMLQGISPARALGPAPPQPQPFATPNSNDSHTTPTNAHTYKPTMLSSSSASSSTEADSSVDRPSRHSVMIETSDDENDSPTKRVRDRVPAFESSQGEGSGRSMMPPKKVTAISTRPQRPTAPPKPLPAAVGRTSAKFAKVAEDPGVEGIPPGVRSLERPSQSFACIIGQAILRSAAGGLSLEHIYRYVETAYPYFKSVDQWRNSVRHNLSIHKIFVTIPRTEKHPPGKGGIWIIDENEKVHWPSEDKFIKNFPSSHPHHAVCRQTRHERQLEQRAREKAEAEGREYVAKKGKKGRAKLVAKDEGHKTPELSRPPPFMLSDHHPGSHHGPSHPPQMAVSLPPPPPHHHAIPPQPRMMPPPPPSSPPRPPSLHPSSFDFEDDGDFVPMETSEGDRPLPPLQFGELSKPKMGPLSHANMPPPPRFGGDAMRPPLDYGDKRGLRDDDDENVFTSGPKRVRLARPEPLSPIHEQQSATSSFLHDDADMFITPSRATSRTTQLSGSAQFGSSALKTPALVQTSSSPTSSPMPPTITRTSHHHPSALQQAWTHDDLAQTTPTSPGKLDAAFDLKPSVLKSDHLVRDDDSIVHSLVPHAADRGPPKTPVTRSSAAADRTPRLGGLRTPGMIHKTPLTYGSPARPPPSASAHLSTPLWEISGVLDRMNAAESPTRTPRSPNVPPTSPTHYSLSDCGDSPIAKRRKMTVA